MQFFVAFKYNFPTFFSIHFILCLDVTNLDVFGARTEKKVIRNGKSTLELGESLIQFY